MIYIEIIVQITLVPLKPVCSYGARLLRTNAVQDKRLILTNSWAYQTGWIGRQVHSRTADLD